MWGAGGALGCLCLLLLDVLRTGEAVSTTEEAGASASTSGILKSAEQPSDSVTTSAAASTNAENEPRSTQVPSLTITDGKGSSGTSNNSNNMTSESQASSAGGAESSTPSANPDTTPSKAWPSTSPMDVMERHLSTGDRTTVASTGGGSFSVGSAASSRAPSTVAVTSGATSPAHGKTTESGAAASAMNSLGSSSTETQPSTGATTSVSISLTTSARNLTSSTSSESPTVATDTATSTTTRHQLTTAAERSLSTPSKTSRSGQNSTSHAQSSSAQTVSSGSQTSSTASPTQGSSAPAVENYCKNMKCPLSSTCVSKLSGYVCQCPLGFYFESLAAACVTGKIFPGSLHLHKLTYSPDMENQDSFVFKTTAANIEGVLSKILKNYTEYVGSIVEKLTKGSVNATVSNFFQRSSSVTSYNVTQTIENFIEVCHDCGPLQKGDSYQEMSLCGPDSCDGTTTTCVSSIGEFSCLCKDGYFKHFPSDRSCMACSSGYILQDKKCVACPFGYGGFNCTDSSLLALVVVSCVLGSLLLIVLLAFFITCCRSNASPKAPSNEQEPYMQWPKQDALKIPRVTMTWDSSHIEMQENGSRNNLVESPVGNGNLADANRPDSLRTFTCKNPTRYSYLCQGQDNPYFISDDHSQVNLK
uniref:Protein HEG-like n=1 Tax=Geotrypetes seraphini TaxID=260995 RepID=A0A6P8NED9_GEOSA|nr:protein HEG-like [Geotrypetes seraphini]